MAACGALSVVPRQRAEGPVSAPVGASGPSPAYLALARLGRTDARLALSAADCSAPEGERDVTAYVGTLRDLLRLP
ncbi:hypothetical protein [Streptomyces sp. NPDC057287]|uniref:hypothetical protein n=1 Tax=Streptomyces sp. NPDC057287 TaxID=3346086 RepID=UPI00362BB531